jgi:hypothetical protein
MHNEGWASSDLGAISVAAVISVPQSLEEKAMGFELMT